MALLELYRRQVACSVVTPLWVVEHLDVVEDIGPCLVAAGVDLATDSLPLEKLEEALGYSVVMAVAATAHAAHQVVIAQEVLPAVSGELTALIRVHRGVVGATGPSAER